MDRKKVFKYIEEHYEEHLNRLKELVRLDSLQFQLKTLEFANAPHSSEII